MARGGPDYGSPGYAFFSVETPIGDVIAEAQGFYRLDNRGRAVYQEDFRSGIHRWSTFGTSGGAVPVHAYEENRSIGYHGSVKLDPVVDDGVSQLSHTIVLPTSIKMGIEFGYFAPFNCGDFNITFGHRFSSTLSGRVQMRIVGGTGNVEIIHEGGTEVIYATGGTLETLNQYVTIKMVGDFSTDKYLRAMLGNTQYDLTTLGMFDGPTALSGASSIMFTCQGASATFVEPIYLQYVIISGDEP